MRDFVIDMSDWQQKAMVLEKIRGLQGMYLFNIKQHRKRRSGRQNRWYFSCFVQPFADFLRGQGYGVSDHDAHVILKERFLKRSLVNEKTGEVLEYTKSTADLDTQEFNEYLDACRVFLQDYAGIQVPDPSIYHEVAA